MEDPDFNDPISTSSSAAPTSASTNNPSSEMIEIISSMGYTAEQAKAALKATDNNLESALDWIFSHMDNLDAAVMEVNSSANNAAVPVDTTSSTVGLESDGKYSLLGFISHIGKNTESGHYVSHIKKDGEWRLYNDEKVALSTKPPFELGFIYFYRLDDAPETL
jgi:ubiquitin carboxyl-terminal hydrolase 5/13